MQKAIHMYPELKQQFLMGSEKARQIGQLICLIIDEEMKEVCQTLRLIPDALWNQILPHLSADEQKDLQEATTFIRAHRDEIFVPTLPPQSERKRSYRLNC
jgi:hypothetical protein